MNTSHYHKVRFDDQYYPVWWTEKHDVQDGVAFYLSNGSRLVLPKESVNNYRPDSTSLTRYVAKSYMESWDYHWDERQRRWTNSTVELVAGEPGTILKVNPGGGVDRLSQGLKVAYGEVIKSSSESSVKPRSKSMFTEFRAYLSEHRDLVFTIIIVALIDHLLLDGALKERLKGLLGGFLDKAETKVSPK